MTWLQHVLGLDNGSGGWYLWWSGAGADLTELAILGGLISMYRRHTCHVHRCWRFAKHPVAGTNFVVCRVHHPGLSDQAPSAEQVEAAHLAVIEGDEP